MTHRLLMTGDLHLGRASTRLPAALASQARAAAAWARVVDLALAERVDALLLSGDVADQANRFWEAIGPLEAGVQRLQAAGIRVLAVAGNHDFGVLGRLADQLQPEHFTLLGRGGVWERTTLIDEGRPWLHVDGWSFPHAVVRASPLDSYALPADPDVPTLGLVHGDLGVATTTYAPLDLARLQALPPRAWLLGHIHAPRLVAPADRPWVLMPGSPQALDPGEAGPHGPWICQIEGSRIAPPVQRPLSAAWYDELSVDVSAADDEPALVALVLEALRTRAAAIAAQAGEALAHVCLRLTLTGQSPVAERARDIAEQLRHELALAAGLATLSVDEVRIEVTPPLDLEAHARSTSALGAMARLLLELDQPTLSDEGAQLVRDARQAMERARSAGSFAGLERGRLTDERVRGLLATQARALLTHLARRAS